MNKKVKITVAISGGVDSSVAAYLLKKEGFDVNGVFLKLADTSSFRESRKAAEKIANSLNVPFSVFDLRKEFEQEIIKCFLEQIKKGVTPNPCVICNEKIKFGLLLDKVLKKNEFLATGHYVQIKSSKSDKGDERYKLFKGKDKTRDQSYFLWRLDQRKLKNILFPLGGYYKKEIKNIASEAGINEAKRPESREICFVRGKLNDFLKNNFKPNKGNIVDTNGKVVGKHEGLYFYTIGQRKGIEIGGMSSPFYVLSKDLKGNNLIVTQDRRDLLKKEIQLKNINWISGERPELPIEVEAKIRYKHDPCLAKLKKGYLLEFNLSQRAVTPGQSAVLYKGEELLGGGVIK
jgi:tRNA-uridine 2-sulfurtransferase